ncbi:hypothetical protein QRB38_13570 [Mycobacterium avium subsp. hominissuis]|uniref:hypothetical protein n=1 Tax=Mycobacterium avium TaxID=1764 RepID=UPI002666A623|nr:hypothetical protein [Mycobacterium avium]MDO2394841.1 hypothetical protein [Mycobacterium avium subsp. hominissuis]
MNTWDHLAENAHRLLTQPRRGDLTPAVTLVQMLHKQPPPSPAAICAHLDTVSTALPQLARYARSGDQHALLMAAVLMRHPLRRIAAMADPDGYRSSDPDARDNDTLRIFFEIIRTAAEPQILTARYLYGQTLKRVLKARPEATSPAAAYRVDPHAAVLDRPDLGADHDHTATLLEQARDRRIITALEHDTLRALYLNSDVFSPAAAARALGANVSAVERRAQRAIRKLCAYVDEAVAA